jgi:hypothetical protein
VGLALFFPEILVLNFGYPVSLSSWSWKLRGFWHSRFDRLKKIIDRARG